MDLWRIVAGSPVSSVHGVGQSFSRMIGTLL